MHNIGFNQNTMFEKLINQINDAVYIVDTNTGGFLDFNNVACKMLGYTRKELFIMKVPDICLSITDQNTWDMKLKETKEKGHLILEGDQRRKDGSALTVELNIKYISHEKNDYLTVIARDITKRKRAEDDLAKAKEEIEIWNKELERKVREKTEELVKSQEQLIQSEKISSLGQMAGGLAHELNSPLAGLLPLIESRVERAVKDSREYDELIVMLKGVQHMAEVVRDFGIFSRKSKGDLNKLSLNELIEDTLSFSKVLLKLKGIEVIKKYDNRLPLVNGNRTELQQVVLNIITNSYDAMSEGGKLIIETGIFKDENRVKVKFIDNGSGIEKEKLKKIFDPFFTTKKPGDGTGLGLSISYGIIEKHGGEILVESDPGKGTKFSVVLPFIESGG